MLKVISDPELFFSLAVVPIVKPTPVTVKVVVVALSFESTLVGEIDVTSGGAIKPLQAVPS